MWWLGLSANRTTLSSMLGQYRGPVEAICPEYIGARWRLARMIWWIGSLVAPIQQVDWGSGGTQRRGTSVPPTPTDSNPWAGTASDVPAAGTVPPTGVPYSFIYENGAGSS